MNITWIIEHPRAFKKPRRHRLTPGLLRARAERIQRITGTDVRLLPAIAGVGQPSPSHRGDDFPLPAGFKHNHLR